MSQKATCKNFSNPAPPAQSEARTSRLSETGMLQTRWTLVVSRKKNIEFFLLQGCHVSHSYSWNKFSVATHQTWDWVISRILLWCSVNSVLLVSRCWSDGVQWILIIRLIGVLVSCLLCFWNGQVRDVMMLKINNFLGCYDQRRQDTEMTRFWWKTNE